jgi:two-component system chemotaxis response regulator CheB
LSAQKIQAEGAGQGITVMIVDDSAVVRQVLSSLLSADRSIKVLAAVSDPIFAMQRMEQQWPDVIVLDIEMPRMDGITFLRKLMAERPTPVVICSTLTEKGAETTLQALDAGAISIITKPRSGLKDFLQDSANDVLTAVKAASRARMSNVKTSN